MTDFDPDLPLVFCVAGDFNRVILNLIVNGSHALSDAGHLKPGDKGTITISIRQDGPWAEIRISDTGTGIPAEIRETIFDPFLLPRKPAKEQAKAWPLPAMWWSINMAEHLNLKPR